MTANTRPMTPTEPESAYWPPEQDGNLVEWTVGDLLRRIAAEVPEIVALKEPRNPADGTQRHWSYARLLAESEQAAQFLLRHFAPGERVAIWATNQPEWVIAQFGAALAGLVLVAINPASRVVELEHALTLSQVSGILLTRRFRDVDTEAMLQSLLPKLPTLRRVFVLDDWARWDWPDPAASVALPEVTPGDVAMLQFTSGTTGKAKAAMLSHRGLVNIAQFSEARFALDCGSIWLNWMPMFHTGGCVFALLSCLWNRGTLILLNGFQPEAVMRAIAEERAVWLPTVPTTALALLDHPSFGQYDLSSLRVATAGGTPVAPELVRRIERELKVDFMMVFGQTETSSTVCLSLRQDTEHHKSATIGKPMPHTEIRIVDPASGAVVPRGAIGEIQVRNFAVTQGYWGQPEATAGVIDAEGWLHTGDLGTMEADGYLTITGRLKDLIIRGGENIYPREIEDILATHPGVAEVAVFGIPDPRWGETVVAAIRSRQPHVVEPAEIKDFLAPLIAHHKIPQQIWLVDDLPVTLSGKIQKFALRDAYLKAMAQR